MLTREKRPLVSTGKKSGRACAAFAKGESTDRLKSGLYEAARFLSYRNIVKVLKLTVSKFSGKQRV
jgi:hypothetical protein